MSNVYKDYWMKSQQGNPQPQQSQSSPYPPPPPQPCPQQPGTLLRVFIPPGAVINLANLIEVSSPAGICLIVRIPLLGGALGQADIGRFIEMVQQAGGSVQVEQQ